MNVDRRVEMLARRLVVVVLLTVAGCHRAVSTDAAPKVETPLELRVTSPREEVWPKTIRVQGDLLSDDEAVIGARTSGMVKKVCVDLGTFVKADQPLAELDTETIALQVQQAEAELEQVRAKLGLKPSEPDEKLKPAEAPSVRQEDALRREALANRDRGRDLRTRTVITSAELQQLEAAVEVAEARYNSAVNAVQEQIALLRVRRTELAKANQALKDAVVRSPFEGTVASRQVSPGEYLQVGDAVVTVVRTDPLRFRAGIPERVMDQVEPGQKLTLHVDRHASPVECRIARISPSLNLSSRSLTIEADVPNADGRLRAGGFGEASIEVDPDARTLVVPATAVFEFAGLEKVFLIRNSVASEQKVTTGRRTSALIEILEGIAPSDTIALEAAKARAGPVQTSSPDSRGSHPAD